MNKTVFLNKFNNSNPSDLLLESDNPNHIFFQRISMDGLKEMHAYSTDKRFYENLGFDPFESIEETRQYLVKLIDRVQEGNAVYWFVRRKKDNRLIGTSGLLRLEYNNQSIEWGFGIDPNLWGEGYILQIMEALKSYVFIDLELNRLYGTTFITNEKTIASLKATGMKEEGILREFIMKNNQFIDGWKYSMLRSEYFSQENNLASDIKEPFDDTYVIEVISKVLESSNINSQSSISNTPKWDSLNHVAIMIELTNKTKIKFNPKQIATATSVELILGILNSRK